MEEYRNNHELWYKNYNKLLEFVNKVKVTNIEEFKNAMQLKGLLSSLVCYVCNNNKPDRDKYWDLESNLGKRMWKFANSYGKVSKELRPLVKYVLWGKHFISDNIEKVINDLLDNKLLWKDNKNQYLVTGLHLATGDNTFTVGRNGEYRKYNRTIGIQAFWVSWRTQNFLNHHNEFTDRIPVLDQSIYSKTSVGDHKYGVKISFQRKDKDFIRSNYVH